MTGLLPSAEALVQAAYLVAAALFILALMWMSHPKTARRGVRAGEIGMLLAVVGTLLRHEVVSYDLVLIAVLLGSAIGVPMAYFMPMTAIPQRTAISHAFGTLVVNPGNTALFPTFVALALVFGVLLVIPFGGADMPTVIALLNSYAGLAASAMGFALDNKLLIVGGALDGTSGFILAMIMCKTMNRSFTNVLFGGFGQLATSSSGAGDEDRPVRAMTAEEAAPMPEMASSVVIIPGYGMAVAQAQHRVAELYEHLEEQGVDVKFAIHPVAGRMPRHMNVLLAQADVPYEKLVEMEDSNPEIPQVDVAWAVGANDTVNPSARDDPDSAIAGMWIIAADKEKSAMIVKRGMVAGFAGIDNPIYFNENTSMLFDDAKNIGEHIGKDF